MGQTSEPHGTPRIARFNFDGLRDFGEPFRPVPIVLAAEEELPPPPPPPPVFSEEERDAAHAAGFAEGHAEGIEEGRAQVLNEDTERREALKQSIAALERQVADLQSAFDAHYVSVQEDTVSLAAAVAKQVCGTTFEDAPLAMFESLVERALPTLLRQPKITATVHPAIEKAARETLESICAGSGYLGTIEVRASDKLQKQDAQLSWADGRADIDMARFWSSIDTLFAGRKPAKTSKPVVETTPSLPPEES